MGCDLPLFVESMVYVLLNGIVIAECILTLCVNMFNERVRENNPTAFANSLALSICLLSCSSFAFSVMSIIEVPNVQVGSLLWCIFLKICVRYLHVVSSVSINCLALDRYLAICRPLHYTSVLTKTKCNLLSLAIWVASFLLLLMPSVGSGFPDLCYSAGERNDSSYARYELRDSFLVSYSVAYILSAITTLTFYTLVILQLRRLWASSSQGKEVRKGEGRLQRRTWLCGVLVIVPFTLLSLPMIVLHLVNRFAKPGDLRKYLRAASVLHRVHFLLFLPLYAWTNVTFRKALPACFQKLWSAIICASASAENGTDEETYAMTSAANNKNKQLQ